jgi:hypothetical protein
MPYPDQNAMIRRAKINVDACHICGGNVGANVIDVKGFRSLSAGGNDTYRALEEAGFAYDAGFLAGVLYLSGHENDTWPYPVENYNLYAVPVSTAELDGIRVPLYDRYIKEDKSLNASQWYELLASKLNESAQKGQPMVAIFSNQVSGSGEYLDAYREFIRYGASRNATFVTTLELINVTKAAGHPQVAASTDVSECIGCDRLKNQTSIKA